MKNQDIEIKIVTKWPENELVDLYKEAGWWKDHYNPAELKWLIKGSFVFIVAIEKKTNRAIGTGRLISDGVSDAYIQDLVITSNYRNRGIGKKMIDVLINYSKKNNISWLGLISEPNQDNFYKKNGFEVLKNYTPMIYKGEK